MIVRTLRCLVLFVVAGNYVAACTGRAAEATRPNVVLILTDNQGAWTLGCYGNRDIRTPNIDRLAREGIRFTHCYANNGVCSPTRATLLTGLMPSQHGVHCYLSAGGAQIGPEAYNTLREFRTLPRILAEAGYTCGLCGKWHLGENLHPQEGFSYWVTMPHGATSTFYDAQVIEKEEIRKEPTYLTDFWTDHAVRFLEQNKDRPFFLYLPYNGPYGLSKLLLEPARNRHAAYYADKPMECFPREPVHPWLHNNREYVNNPVSMRRYAAEISGVDDGVGRVLETLTRLGLDRNTLVIFTADQGLACGQHGLWAMGDHTRPLTAFEDQVQVPLIYRLPGRITPGREADLLVSHCDLLPSVLTYLGLPQKIPREPSLPGRNYAPLLEGRSIDWDNVVYYEFENLRMVRTREAKLIRRFPDGPDELYDLRNDPGERTNLAGRAESAAMEKQLAGQLEAFFQRYADPKYDLWHGGRSKAHLLIHPEQGPAPQKKAAAKAKKTTD